MDIHYAQGPKTACDLPAVGTPRSSVPREVTCRVCRDTEWFKSRDERIAALA